MRDRVIKFRGKDERGCWHIGWLAEANDGTIYIVENDERWTDDGFHNDDFSGWYKVLEETVGQFTGLLDENGKEIYEGDVLSSKYWEKSIVKWINEDARFTLIYSEDDYGMPINQSWFIRDEIQVLGNIHDNPNII